MTDLERFEAWAGGGAAQLLADAERQEQERTAHAMAQLQQLRAEQLAGLRRRPRSMVVIDRRPALRRAAAAARAAARAADKERRGAPLSWRLGYEFGREMHAAARMFRRFGSRVDN